MDLAFIQSPEFPNWLARQEGETLAWLAERIALREAPMWFDQILGGYGYPSEPRFTPLLRSLISMRALRRFPGEAELQRLSVYSARVAKVYLDSGGAFYSAASVLDYQTEGDFNHHNAAYSAYESSGHGGRWCMEEVLHDVMSVAGTQSPTEAPLWRAGADKAAEHWATVAADWREPDSSFSFWARWYQAALEGTPMDPELQRAIALIPDDVWRSGPGPVAEAIRVIEEDFLGRSLPVPLNEEIEKLPRATVADVHAAMDRNRVALPPTFDAVEGLILLEIERLQRHNDIDDEWKRQMSIYLTLYEAIHALRENLPSSGKITVAQAETSEQLLRLYMRKFGELPRAKVDEVVEGVWTAGKGMVQVGLIGVTVAMMVAYGLPAYAGVSVGALIFAPKNAADIIKAAKEAFPGSKASQ